jgi:hypothetical protein
MAPELKYISSWVDGLSGAIRSTDDRAARPMVGRWNDLVDFEVHPVITSLQAAERVEPQL